MQRWSTNNEKDHEVAKINITIQCNEFGEVLTPSLEVDKGVTFGSIRSQLANCVKVKEEYKEKQYVVVLIALASIFNFFYVGLFGDNMQIQLGNLPFHLCNAATILIFCAFAFKREELFYFNFFVNVLGCIFAMLMPDYDKTDYCDRTEYLIRRYTVYERIIHGYTRASRIAIIA